ncbi:Piso0_000291 [Millerozyma farinosa CBS 7064]|uniref:L-lactate dehydrogenase (cytochrome) n=1 Tax=Pichia sorbitophila (strain ATCC MYA-4447 / BCRC 22081 / CBS 7064 / NBRC 10061 / NRRL Y-12695) TaxID=559304 RepID=G8YV17_PICSO|nr:Piso0_000291 [Millerozyma farinosa CBS 7064]
MGETEQSKEQAFIEETEVRKHNSKQDCWVIIHGKAYDVSSFVDEHPGGSAVILKYAGRDATKAFDPIHPSDTLTKYLSPDKHLGPVKKAPRKPHKEAAAKPTTQEAKHDEASEEYVDEFDVEYDEQADKKEVPFEKVGVSSAEEGSTTAASDAGGDGDDYLDDEDDEDLDEEDIKRREMARKKPDIGQIYNLNDFEFVARHTMDKVAWCYYSSGCDDEITLRENHLAYQRFYFKPRVMVDVSNIDLSTTMLGTKTSSPFYITATALGRLGHPDGEKVLTRAAAKQDIIQMIPTLASCSFDEIVDQATDSQTQWFQLYVHADREICRNLIVHAEKRGVKGLFITVDAPQLGRREKDMRSKNFEDLSHVQEDDEGADRSQGAARAISSFIDTSLSWKDIKWFRSVTKMPIVLKGVQTIEDALIAAEHGVDGIVLSNHGGRQLEFTRPPIELLSELMPILRKRNMADRMEVYVDGGVRRATDVLKAICLGAKGVGIGRPFLYAMSTYGDDGVFKAIQILKDEMIMNMRLLGVTSIDQLSPNYIDSRVAPRFIPEDALFSSVYQPLVSPPFKESKL